MGLDWSGDGDGQLSSAKVQELGFSALGSYLFLSLLLSVLSLLPAEIVFSLQLRL